MSDFDQIDYDSQNQHVEMVIKIGFICLYLWIPYEYQMIFDVNNYVCVTVLLFTCVYAQNHTKQRKINQSI